MWSRYDRVSRVPDLPDRSLCKVGAKPRCRNLVLGQELYVERWWSVSKSMCPKAERFRIQNSVNNGCGELALPGTSLLVSWAGNAKPIRYSQPMVQGHNRAKAGPPSWLNNTPLHAHGIWTCRWITSLAGSSLPRELIACQMRTPPCGCSLGLKLRPLRGMMMYAWENRGRRLVYSSVVWSAIPRTSDVADLNLEDIIDILVIC